MTNEHVTIISLLLGPFGGLFGVAFGMGAASGFGFCVALLLKPAYKSLAKLETEIHDIKRDCQAEQEILKAELAQLRGMLMGKKAFHKT